MMQQTERDLLDKIAALEKMQVEMFRKFDTFLIAK